MRRRSAADYLGGIFVAVAVTGYPAVSFLEPLLNIASEYIVVSVAASTILLGVSTAVARKPLTMKREQMIPLLALLLLWISYGIRLASVAYSPEPLFRPARVYWFYLVGTVIIPGTIGMIVVDKETLSTALSTTLWVVALGLSGHLAVAVFEGADAGRFSHSALNPISISRLGAVGSVLGLVGFQRTTQKATQVLSAITAIIGGIVLLLGAARGPAIALAISVVYLAIVEGSIFYNVKLWVSIAVLVGVVYFNRSDMNALGWVIFRERGLDLLTLSGGSVEERLYLWKRTLSRIAESPLLGSGIEVEFSFGRHGKMYPHNFILESVLACGALGATLLSMVGLYTIRGLYRLASRGLASVWLGALTILYVASGMFSGAFYNLSQMWFCIGVLSITAALSK